MNIINWNKIEQKAAKCSKNATSATNARVKRDPSTNKMHLLSKMHNNDEKKSANIESEKYAKNPTTLVYTTDGVYHTPLGRFSKLDCSTTTRVPILDDISSESP